MYNKYIINIQLYNKYTTVIDTTICILCMHINIYILPPKKFGALQFLEDIIIFFSQIQLFY